jgi:hypothetical protein
VEAVRARARPDERASRDQRRLLNRLRHHLRAVFPAALDAFPKLSALSALAELTPWPTAEVARRLSAAAIEHCRRQPRHGPRHPQPRAAAARMHAAFQAAARTAPAPLVRATTGAIQVAAPPRRLRQRQRQRQRAAWEARRRARLLGAAGHPDGAVRVSLPGLDARRAARVLGAIGERRERFLTPAARQCSAGTAPSTTAAGKGRAVRARWAGNRCLRQALLRWACCALPRSRWACACSDRQRAAATSHSKGKALRALANRWLEIRHRRRVTGQRYDEALHQRHRTKRPLRTAAYAGG